MVPSPSHAAALADLRDFEDYASDMLGSDERTFQGNLRQFVFFQRNSEFFDRVLATELVPMDFEAWFHAMFSAGEVRWPDDKRQKLFLMHRLLGAIVDERFDVARVVPRFYGLKPGESVVAKFNHRIVQFFAREYLKLAQQAAKKIAQNEAKPSSVPPPATPSTMDVFISHSSKDEQLAGAIAHLLQIALGLERKHIRCTSANAYRLPVGTNTDAQLKEEVHGCQVLVGLITPTSVQSSYVLFELGARWGLDRFMAPLLAKGAPARSLPGPMAGINALRADDEEQMHQFLGDIAGKLGRPAPEAAGYTKYLKEVVLLARAEGEKSAESAAQERAEPVTVTSDDRNILGALWNADDGLSFEALAAKVELSLADTKYRVEELQELDFVDASPEPDDEAIVSIKLAGKRYLKKQRRW